MRPVHALLVALIVGLLVLSVPLSSGNAPYSVHNRDALGLGHWLEGPLADARSHHGPLGELDPQRDALLVVGPRLGYSDAEADRLAAFLQQGGRALVADAGGSGRGLVEGLGLELPAATVFSTSYDRTPAYPIAEDQGVVPGLPATVVLSRPHAVLGPGEPVLRAHPYSWLDLDNDLAPDLDEPRGPWALAMLLQVGEGEVLVVGDPDLFTAAMRPVAGNAAEALLQWLSQDRQVVVDEGHRAHADPVGMAPVLAGAAPGRVLLVLAALLVTATVIGLQVKVRRLRPRRKRTPPRPDPVLEAVRRELPP